jgi:Kef-type K+ transport system membrane component KefB
MSVGGFAFLPTLPLQGDLIVLFGALLLGGLLGGEAVFRLLSLPRIFGYVLAGVVLGAAHVVQEPLVQETRVFADVALGLIVFDLGRRVDFPWMLKERWLLIAGAAESVLTFFIVFFVLGYFGVPGAWRAVAAAIAIATSPPVVMLVVNDVRAEGLVTDRVLLQTSLNCTIASVAVAVLTSALHAEHGDQWTQVALHPIYLVLGSLFLASLMLAVLLRVAAWCGKREEVQFILTVSAVVLTVGFARMFKLPVLLVPLALGAFARNLDRKRVLRNVELGSGARIFVVVLFVLTGASLHLRYLASAALPAVAYVLARMTGKTLGTAVPSWLAGVSLRKAGLVILSLQPLSVTAVVMALDTAALYPAEGGQLTAIVLSAVAFLELAGPLAVQFALKKAGEVPAEAVA